MRKQRLLVVGAGIAGLSAAHWLAKDGHSVVAVDKASRFDPQGHFIALKGTGVEVLSAMGLKDTLQEYVAPMLGARILDTKGKLIREQPFSKADATLGGYMMVRRADLHLVLHESLPESVDLRFGTTPQNITQDESGVNVTFNDNSNESFDFLLACDGVHSKIREEFFPHSQVQNMRGYYTALFIENFKHDISLDAVDSYIGNGRMLNLLPLSDTKAGILSYQDDQTPTPPFGCDGKTWKNYFLDIYKNYPEKARRAFEGITTDSDIFADNILMVKSSRATNGRIALVGDAGYGPSFFSGMGAAVAMQGAYCIAQHLKNNDDCRKALKAYEDRIIPLAQQYQSGANTMRNIVLGRELRWRILRRTLLGYLPDILQEKATRRYYRTETKMVDLAK